MGKRLTGWQRRGMADNGAKKLNPRQVRFVAALLSEKSVTAAATSARIGLRTAWRYLGDPAVQAALSEKQDAMLSHAALQIAQDMATALDTLREIATDKTASSAARVGAARVILSHAIQLIELTALAERVARLEDREPE